MGFGTIEFTDVECSPGLGGSYLRMSLLLALSVTSCSKSRISWGRFWFCVVTPPPRVDVSTVDSRNISSVVVGLTVFWSSLYTSCISCSVP